MHNCCKNSADGPKRKCLKATEGNKCFGLHCGYTYRLISHQPQPVFIGPCFVVAFDFVSISATRVFVRNGVKDFIVLDDLFVQESFFFFLMRTQFLESISLALSSCSAEINRCCFLRVLQEYNQPCLGKGRGSCHL